MEEYLPDRIYLDDYKGDFSTYLDAAYAIFRNDFVVSKPIYRGVRLGLKRYPLHFNKECTFYHLTHEGNDENNRIPNMRRIEMIGFPRPIIDNSENNELKVWRNRRGNKTRILLFYEAEDYLVVLDDRGKYILPWTAYIVTTNHKRRKLIKEYEEYINAKTA
ncbi:MAG: hypothetical protein CL868_05860 [Cytophagaceae bacterium]|nr:hypothetical protein [Cytophagaceae bacterium]|tara:strand:- start:10952 stop:11437 length:486 start_codon:yes stop_codon:yes gene_type:complete